MRWEKLGQVWAPDGALAWSQSNAQLPVVQPIAPDRWWVYFSTRDGQGKSHIGRIELDVGELATHGRARVVGVDAGPVLAPGEPGTFDDSGVMPSWIWQDGRTVRMYYTGWNVLATVPYRLAIGLAISDDGGQTFRRYSRGPLIDRTVNEPFFSASPCVLRDGDAWRMWYVSCTGWEKIHDHWEPHYHVKFAESRDGIAWEIAGRSCVEPEQGSSIAKPCVVRRPEGYAMLYSIRSVTDYRTNRDQSYRLGYAESADGLTWTRHDDRAGISASDDGWDSQMIAYGWLQEHAGATYLLYNGNGFGKTGFGVARLVEW